MADIVSPTKRSQMMSGIKGKDTKPEMIVRRELFRRGFRFRLHDRKLPGKPDLVFKKYNAIINVNGCFWHGHNCHLFKWPKSNVEFWRKKITGNIERDSQNHEALVASGWRVLTIWECSIRNKTNDELLRKMDKVSEWLLNDAP